jgi:predicted dehydrogenase
MGGIDVGVIGCGYWGPNLIRNFVEIPDANVMAVADLKSERLNYIGARYSNISLTKDYHDLFAMNLDAVVVATPPPTHYGLARECLEHDLHVMVEKPLTLSSQDAETLIDIAQSKDLALMVGHTFEYNPAVRVLKDLIDRGELGEIYYINSVRVNLGLFQSHLSVLWDLAPHDISILLYLLDCDPISVNACGAANILEGIEDLVYVYLEFPDNILAHVHVSWLDPNKVRRTTIVGSKKMVVYDDVSTIEKIKIYDKGVEAPPYTDTYGEFQCSYRYGDVVIPNIRFTEPLRVECQHFLDAIVSGTEPQSNGYAGLRVVKVLELAERSMHNGGEPCQAFDTISSTSQV